MYLIDSFSKPRFLRGYTGNWMFGKPYRLSSAIQTYWGCLVSLKPVLKEHLEVSYFRLRSASSVKEIYPRSVHMLIAVVTFFSKLIGLLSIWLRLRLGPEGFNW
jgi:hypothetical protein